MRHYRIYIGGYGGEQCFGAITKEQYEFWKDLEEHHLISHMMDPYEEDDDNPVFDSEDLVEGSETEKIKDVVVQSYYNSDFLRENLDEETYQKVRNTIFEKKGM